MTRTLLIYYTFVTVYYILKLDLAFSFTIILAITSNLPPKTNQTAMQRVYQPSVKKLSTLAIQRYFERETFTAHPITDTILTHFISEITQKYFVNIGAKLFHLVPSEAETFYSVIHWLGYERYPTTSTLKRFLTDPLEVKNELKIDENAIDFKEARFRNLSGFTLDGELAEILYFGGAYRQEDDPAVAKNLAKTFTDRLLKTRFPDFIIYTATIALGNWYGAIGIDHTFLIFDQTDKNYYVLAISDVD